MIIEEIGHRLGYDRNSRPSRLGDPRSVGTCLDHRHVRNGVHWEGCPNFGHRPLTSADRLQHGRVKERHNRLGNPRYDDGPPSLQRSPSSEMLMRGGLDVLGCLGYRGMSSDNSRYGSMGPDRAMDVDRTGNLYQPERQMRRAPPTPQHGRLGLSPFLEDEFRDPRMQYHDIGPGRFPQRMPPQHHSPAMMYHDMQNSPVSSHYGSIHSPSSVDLRMEQAMIPYGHRGQPYSNYQSPYVEDWISEAGISDEMMQRHGIGDWGRGNGMGEGFFYDDRSNSSRNGFGRLG
ncbi:hypothetical protein CJF32_00003972 [Rutstroemia sp. NJR-2017a WRK4]|nr:hypothetical protein CJF32_00003972 [Rutstroemia sp. NJR-2017a WRK4]